MRKKALICGISGQDGSLLAKFLVERGYTVIGTSRDAELASFANLKLLKLFDRVSVRSMNLKDFGQVFKVLNDTQPDEVYNLSGQSSVGMSFEQPIETTESIVTGTLNLLEVARQLTHRPKIYCAGSSEVFGEVPIGEPAKETTRFSPVSPYGVAKASAHWYVSAYRRAYGLFACSGLLFNHESPLRPARFATQKIVREAVQISRGRQNSMHLGNVEVIRDWGWAEEYVDAMWRMLQLDEPKDFVIATGRSNSLADFVSRVFAVLNMDWENRVNCDETLVRASEIHANYADPSAAGKELNWTAQIGFDELIEKLVSAELARST